MERLEVGYGKPLSDAQLALVVQSMDLAGIAAVHGAVRPELVAELRAAVRADLDAGRRVESQPGTNQWATMHDVEGPFAHPDVLANPVMLQIGTALMGSGWTCSIYNTNVAVPGSTAQRVHQDHPRTIPPAPVREDVHLAWHLTLCDFTDDNGSTQMWPGSHKCVIEREVTLEDAAAVTPSVRGNAPAGTFIMREGAMWHRAMPNVTSEPREMLSFFACPAGSPTAGAPVGRPLVIPRDVLESLPTEAQSVWGVNQIIDR